MEDYTYDDYECSDGPSSISNLSSLPTYH